jgi:Domain of unknown function (DUF1707)/Cell wall-active antibiotics response 4TMS YvqF
MADREEQDVALRASDAERERTVEALRAAAGEGRLTLEELAERVGDALVARTRGELEPLTADLPAPVASPEPGREGTRWTVSIMSGNDRKGRWRIAARSTVVNIIGGSDLDLRDALIDAPETVITVISVMGGSDIIVPEGVDVRMGGFAVMGGNDLEVDGPPPPPGAPIVHVRAFSLMGGTDVKVKPRERGAPSSGGAPSLQRPR